MIIEPKDKPIAYLWIMHMEGGQKQKRLEFNGKSNPFGKPGIDYSSSFAVTATALYGNNLYGNS